MPVHPTAEVHPSAELGEGVEVEGVQPGHHEVGVRGQRFRRYAMRVNGGKFEIVGRVKADAAIGPDTCTRF